MEERPRRVRLRRTVGFRPPGRPGWGAVVAVGLICAILGGLLGAAAVVGAAGGRGRLAALLRQEAAAPVPAPAPGAGVPAPGVGAPAPGVGAVAAPAQAGIPAARLHVEFTSAVSDAAARVGPAVVGIVSQVRRRTGYGNVGTGSGVIFDQARGLIVTNAHVVAGAQRLLVKVADTDTFPADLVGADEVTDLAVVRVTQGALPAQAEFGDSDRLRVGDLAVAIGNPLGLDFQRTVTAGIISGINRELSLETESGLETTLQVLQTDAAINPGNSGGALVNAAGQVVGINSAKVARQGVEGIGFAIPINVARPVVQDLISHGRVVRPVLGVRGYRSQAEQEWETGYDGPGVVLEVLPGGAAQQAGLRSGDILLAIDGRPVNRLGEMMVALGRYRPGDQVTLKVRRFSGGRPLDFAATATLLDPGQR